MSTRISVDINIILSAKNGNIDAFEHILSQYECPIYSFIYRMVQNRNDALDLTQETFVRLYRHMGEYDSQKNFSAWVFTISRRIVYDWFRKNKRREWLIVDDPERPLDPPDDRSSILSPYQKIGDKIDMETALSHLPPRYKEVLLLYYWQGYPYADIAYITDTPVNTVKTLIRRAKQSILTEMEKKPVKRNTGARAKVLKKGIDSEYARAENYDDDSEEQ